MTIMEHVNGTRGRIAPALPEHTFKDSGITIKIRKVGPTTQQRLAQAIMKELPDPPAPIVETEVGKEANTADPDWLGVCEAKERERKSELTQRLMLIAALEAEVTIDDRAKADIARKRRNMDLAGIPYHNPALSDEENDKVFYILFIAAATPEDLGEFSQAVLRRSVPTEEAVQAQIATFQRDLPE